MSFDYGKTKATAHRLLTKFGASGVLRRVLADTATYDPATATTTQPAELQTSCIAVVIAYPAHLVDGTRIRTGDQLAYISAVSATSIKVDDLLVWQGVTYSVVNAKELAPAGVNVLWTVQVRV